ncbi:MAG: DUF2993 domain-containing protein [Leptolyngbyaceae cyanobacterium bins.349]|nr:DUF2993 domain-containing protein [Leptolyngbyaceae cyanobacterium bins.349]
MEAFILILSSLISVLSPANLAADKVIESNVRSQFQAVETLEVRVDNAPTSNYIRGKVNRLRIAGRGFFPLEDIRIDTLELETDPINVSVADARRQRYVLQQPLGVAVKVVIRQDDVLRALRSRVINRAVERLLQGLNRRKSLESSPSNPTTLAQGRLRDTVETIRNTVEQYRISNPRVEFLGDRRIQLEADIEDTQTGDKLKLTIETGFEILEGRRFQFLRPTVAVNGQPVPEGFVKDFAENIAQQLDLGRLEKLLQVRARIFRVQFVNNSLEFAAFVGLPAGFRI